MPLTMTAAAAILADHCAPWIQDNLGLVVETVGDGSARLRLPRRERLLNPAGRISEQAMMTLANTTMIVVVASSFGEYRAAATVNQAMTFIRAIGAVDIIAEGRVLKRGRNLVFGEVAIHVAGSDEPIAHATSTYSLLAATDR